MRYLKRIFPGLLALFLAVAAAAGIYISDFYEAEPAALAAMITDDLVQVTVQDRTAVFAPARPEAGLIFYPGGKVAYTAYAPLMQALARENILCVLVEMPGNLAVLDMDAAAQIPARFPQVDRWYIGGHSLGGSMAAAWAGDHPELVQGVALLASYSTADLTQTGLKVLSIDGTQDGVLNREKQVQYRPNLPRDLEELSIPGGNHAQFGAYGPQEGDGEATITPQEQIAITAEALAQWMK